MTDIAGTTPAPMTTDATSVPRLPLMALFLRFLNFGLHAWGGPVAQIAMLRSELVERERWISPQRFNRALAVYQVLPGPEAHELCCYFGFLARGRLGALIAGFGFMLPGFILMLALSLAYASYGLASPLILAAFAGIKPAVAALVVRAVHRIGGHALHRDFWLWAIALVSLAASLAGAHFAVLLLAGGLAFAAARRWWWVSALCLVITAAAGAWALSTQIDAPLPSPIPAGAAATPLHLLWAGLKAGLLTFGGAYTVIPFLRDDAVHRQQWLSDAQFLDGIGISGVLPAPLVIFGTFIGFIAGGCVGAAAMTAGIFAPAFAFTIVGHGLLERLVNHQPTHRFLDGVTAAVVGLIAATAIGIARTAVTSWETVAIFALALIALYCWKAKAATPVTVLAGGVAGVLLLN
ncbi:MAG: chromate efflux transporter [Phycisphaerales bacterium]|nr:chromate efflux transporter [Phycisphaerales bacterium]